MARRDKRLQIIRAAEKLFSGRRFHELTMGEIAARAEVGKGTLYLYFESKERLFFAVLSSGFDELCALLRRRISEEAPFAQQLLDACRQISEFFERRRPLFRMIMEEDARMSLNRGLLREHWLTTRQQLRTVMGEIMAKGVAEGLVRRDVPPEVLAEFVLGMLRTRAHDLEDAPARWRKYEVIVDLFCQGAREAGQGPAVAAPREAGRSPALPGGTARSGRRRAQR